MVVFAPDKPDAGLAELRAALRKNNNILAFAGLFSVFANLLMLTGPLFMLLVYDRVLPGRSEATLVALIVLVAFLYGVMWALNHVRGRLLSRIGARFQAALDHRVFSASLTAANVPKATKFGTTGLRDLEAIQKLLSSPVFATCFDLPFTPVFLAGIWVFHPLLGTLALTGGGLLIAISVVSNISTRRQVLSADSARLKSNTLSATLAKESETIRSLGMQDAAFQRWRIIRDDALLKSLASTDATARFTGLSLTLRLFLQSAMLGLGAWLVLKSELSAGAMIAGTILLGRALGPVEVAIAGWSGAQRARQGWHNLQQLLTLIPHPENRIALPRPKAYLQVHQLTIAPPGERQAALRMVSFELHPGQAIGVIGTSGSGKSTLARALTGTWLPTGGEIRLDGATLEQFNPSDLGRHIGYLPQRVELFEGTVTENIAGLAPSPDPADVVAAAKKADAHQMILGLAEGYDTRVAGNGGQLSGGQIQRIGLARALYGRPVIVVLDEPNSNLDNDGTEALNQAIRNLKAENASVLIMAHRPAAIQECELLLVLESGARRDFGHREQVLKSVLQNHQKISRLPGSAGMS